MAAGKERGWRVVDEGVVLEEVVVLMAIVVVVGGWRGGGVGLDGG